MSALRYDKTKVLKYCIIRLGVLSSPSSKDMIMRLPIEDWLSSQELSRESEGLFRESITCYKASAYRAAFLFSFLAFQTVIRDRIVNAQVPTGIPYPFRVGHS